MNKLTAEKCRELLAERYRQRDSGDISIGGSFTLQALEIALPVLENPEPAEYQYYYHNHGTGSGEWLPVRSKQTFEEMKERYAGDNDFSFRELFTHPSTTPQIDNDGWIEWGGGECPINPMAIVEVKFTLTPQGEGIANWWDWHHGEGENNIIAYRVIEKDGRAE